MSCADWLERSHYEIETMHYTPNVQHHEHFSQKHLQKLNNESIYDHKL